MNTQRNPLAEALKLLQRNPADRAIRVDRSTLEALVIIGAQWNVAVSMRKELPAEVQQELAARARKRTEAEAQAAESEGAPG